MFKKKKKFKEPFAFVYIIVIKIDQLIYAQSSGV